MAGIGVIDFDQGAVEVSRSDALAESDGSECALSESSIPVSLLCCPNLAGRQVVKLFQTVAANLLAVPMWG